MICTDCGDVINKNKTYYRLNNSGSTFCSKDCVHSGYKGFYSDSHIKKGLQSFTRYK